MSTYDDFLWVEKYRPRRVANAILPKQLKDTFQQFVSNANVPNILLTGRAGVGKTTVARAVLEELGADYIVINGSMNGNIDTLRNDILDFASTVSFSGGRKYVILDEADYLNPNSTQPALRNFMEEYSKNCGFILTCNYVNKIIEPLQSRCSIIDFVVPKEEKPKLAAQFFASVTKILENESVEFDKKAVADVVTKHFPDFRRVLNELQKRAATGRIDANANDDMEEKSFEELVQYIKNKQYTNVRKWVAENSFAEPAVFFRKFYDKASVLMEPLFIPQLVMILANYQYKAAFVADQEINLAACMAEIMVECQFK